MKIEIDSLGEGHTADQITKLMTAIHELCARSGLPHTLIIATLNYSDVVMPDNEARKLWSQATASGNTNMAFTAWNRERLFEQTVSDLTLCTMTTQGDFYTRFRGLSEELTGQKEDRKHDFLAYAHYYDACVRDDVKLFPYPEWVKEQSIRFAD